MTIISAHNPAGFTSLTLAALLAKELLGWELLVENKGNPDDTDRRNFAKVVCSISNGLV